MALFLFINHYSRLLHPQQNIIHDLFSKKNQLFSHIFGVKYRKQTVVATENLSVHSSEKPFLYVDRGYGIFLSRKAISKMLTFLCDKIVIYFHTFKFLKYSNTS